MPLLDPDMTSRRLPHNFGGQGRHSKKDRGPELYPTPESVTQALLSAEKLPQNLWEPAAGMGHMASVLVRAGHNVSATDLYDYGLTVPFSPPILAGVDFQTCAENGDVRRAAQKIDAVVTNPPFSIAEDFVRVGLRLVPRVYILARLAFVEGNKRSDIIDNHLVRVYPFVNRLPMLHRWIPDDTGKYVEWPGKKSSSQTPYAWFVFESTRRADQLPTLRRIRCHKVKKNVT